MIAERTAYIGVAGIIILVTLIFDAGVVGSDVFHRKGTIKWTEYKRKAEKMDSIKKGAAWWRALKKSSRYEDFSIINKKADCT